MIRKEYRPLIIAVSLVACQIFVQLAFIRQHEITILSIIAFPLFLLSIPMLFYIAIPNLIVATIQILYSFYLLYKKQYNRSIHHMISALLCFVVTAICFRYYMFFMVSA